ncbi:hypothetical protein N7462_010669 [Penicillium macrosclerotiorum]|uniref:uncharacterized protein n=1 Tax=Penicillium macrosclerotiorum TaxID=303699 RepID=UPI002546F117|nr:uncharacterized protein N7462_010669 [Penicillium macrosclerotiorum]KAJ5669599.1 hypothetical protein N7462_010669 [Penicillium macrosclerotiorum]
MSPEPEKPKKAPRKHVTTACVPCRESKIRVCILPLPHAQRSAGASNSARSTFSVTDRPPIVKIVSGRPANASFRVSLRAATELFSARIDQLIQFIHCQGLEPPPMKPDDEAGMNRVLDTLQIPRGFARNTSPLDENQKQKVGIMNTGAVVTPPVQSPPTITPPAQSQQTAETPTRPEVSPSHSMIPNQQLPSAVEPWNPFGMVRGVPENQNFVHWGFTLPTAESLDNLYANINGGPGLPLNTGLSPDSFQLGMDMAQQPGVLLSQISNNQDHESESGEENEAESDVIEQLSHRIGTLKIAGDGHLRFYGATSNLNLVDVSATQQRQRPDARTVRHDGQDILNHLRVGQAVDQALEDHLVELYFTWQNPSIYVVDKDMYMTARAKWRNEFDDTPFYSEVLTNAMCAIGSAFEARYHPTFITFPKSLAEFFADRAKALLEIELDSPCVATVQALVLMSCHEGASNRDARGWLYSGMSMRLAFDLGLHLDMTSYVKQGDISSHEADVRRAAFWGSYVADHFWGFYLGRPFRMNAGDVSVPKPASTLGVEKEGIWHPYGLQSAPKLLESGLKNPTELICRQFVVLWEMISPVGHILYGCSDISRHDLQRLCFQVTEDLFAWKANLPSALEIDLNDDTTPRLPHLLILHMQYHQIIIFFHRPWVSKSYIQPRSPRQGPGYLHARRMCVESATAVARLLCIYEKHFTFRRMNNQVVAIIFSAALMLLFVTVSSSPLMPTKAGESIATHPRNAEMVAYLNLCFRALDELGQSFENAKRTRDYLVTLQRRWQAHMRRAGPGAKRQISSANLSTLSSQQPATSLQANRTTQGPDASRKKSRLVEPGTISSRPRHNSSNSVDTQLPSNHAQSYQGSTPIQPQLSHRKPSQSYQLQPQSFPNQPGDLNWIRDSDLNLLSNGHVNGSGDNPLNSLPVSHFSNDTNMLPDLGDIEGWWSPTGNS